jgi:hypothetical protein
MGKVIKNTLYFIIYMIIGICMAVYESIKYIFRGSSFAGKVVLVGLYSGVISIGVFEPNALLIVLGIVILIDALFAAYMVLHSDSASTKQKGNSAETKKTQGGFFDGMNLEDAKKEYRKLMKQYHPDNNGGDLEMAQIISEAYRQFCVVNGR